MRLGIGTSLDIVLGRTAEPLTRWLKQDPGVEIIARDRASAYAEAARSGAPGAVQVTDRFHLVRNVSDALREVVDRQTWALPEPMALPASVVEEITPTPEISSRAARMRAEAAQRLQTRYEEVSRRHRNGESHRAIGRATGLDRKTVRKYIQSADIPKRAERRPVARNLDPFIDYLGDRWRAGCHSARKLSGEIRQLGYSGSESMVRHTLHPWRDRVPEELHTTRVDRYKWKEVRWAVLCPPERLRQDQRQCLQEFLAMHPSLARVYELRQRFRQILREHLGAELDPWLQEAAAYGLRPFERLAKTLTVDRAAVLAAVELPWSTGRVEGTITRLKFVKRLGYGRASMPLLRARLIGSC